MPTAAGEHSAPAPVSESHEKLMALFLDLGRIRESAAAALRIHAGHTETPPEAVEKALAALIGAYLPGLGTADKAKEVLAKVEALASEVAALLDEATKEKK